MTGRDDMVMRIGGRRTGSSAPVRAREQRKTRAAERRRARLLRTARRMASAKGAARSRKRGASSTRKGGSTAGKVLRGAGKAAGRALIAAEVLIAMGREFRRYSQGKSARLLDAEDAHTMLRDKDEQATAAVRARGVIESNPHMLEMVHFNGMEASGVGHIAAHLRKQEMKRASAEDMLNRRRELDSADKLVDKFVKRVLEGQTRAKMDEAMERLRWLRGAFKGTGR